MQKIEKSKNTIELFDSIKGKLENAEIALEILRQDSDTGIILELDNNIKDIRKLLDDVEEGRICSLDDLGNSFEEMHKSYYNWEWTWACEKLEEETGFTVNKLTAQDIIGIVEKWKKSVD